MHSLIAEWLGPDGGRGLRRPLCYQKVIPEAQRTPVLQMKQTSAYPQAKHRRGVGGNKIFNKLLAKVLATLVDHLLCHTAHFLRHGAGLFCKHEKGSHRFSLVHMTEASYKLRRVVGGNRPPTFFLSAVLSLLFLTNRSKLWRNLWAKRSSTDC